MQEPGVSSWKTRVRRDGTKRRKEPWRGVFPLFRTMDRRGQGLPVRCLDVPDGIAPSSPSDPTWSDHSRAFRISLRFEPGFGLVRSDGRLLDPVAGALPLSVSDPVAPCLRVFRKGLGFREFPKSTSLFVDWLRIS